MAASPHDLRPADVEVEHSFQLNDESPIHQSARGLAPRYNDVVRGELGKMLKAGIITPSASAWSFLVVSLSKKDGNPRSCVDYIALNERWRVDRWPLPKIDEIFDDIKGSKYFSALELFSAYWKIRMAEHCKKVATFMSRYRT